MTPSAGAPSAYGQRLNPREQSKTRGTLRENYFRGDAAEPTQHGSLQRMHQWGSKPQLGT